MIYLLATADACSDYALVNILSITQTAFMLICIIVPIILIVSLAISLFGAVTDPEKKGLLKSIISKVGAALIIFFLPTIVNLIMTWLPDNSGGLNITSCWEAARSKATTIQSSGSATSESLDTNGEHSDVHQSSSGTLHGGSSGKF